MSEIRTCLFFGSDFKITKEMSYLVLDLYLIGYIVVTTYPKEMSARPLSSTESVNPPTSQGWVSYKFDKI